MKADLENSTRTNEKSRSPYALGGARVAFLKKNAINESLGLCDLAGRLRDRGVTTRLFLELEERRLPARLREFEPHLVVIPCDLMGHNSAQHLARTAKAHTAAPVVLGGVHPTFFPNIELRPGVDFAFAGEAEGVVSDLLAAAQLIREAGIRLITFSLLGRPYCSIEQEIDTCRLAQTMGVAHPRVTIVTPFPKSVLTRKLIRDGYLSPHFEERIYEVADLPSWLAEDLFPRTGMEVTKRLFRLWHLMAALRLSPKWMRRLVDRPWLQFLAPVSLLIAMLNEQKIFGMGDRQGFRYLLHVRSPRLKASNYVSFISRPPVKARSSGRLRKRERPL